MKKTIFAAMAAIVFAGTSFADVTVKFPAGQGKESYDVEHMLISNMIKPRGERPSYSSETVKTVKNVLTISTDPAGAAFYVIPLEGRDRLEFYTNPGENVVVDVKSLSPLDYSVSGTELMEGIYTLKPLMSAIETRYMNAAKAEPRDTAAMSKALVDFNKVIKDYISMNPKNPAVVYAVMQLDGNDFLEAFSALDSSLAGTALYPLAERQKASVESRIAADKHRAELASGNTMAPAFTFKDLEGKDVSLIDFRGKWVVLDFWGAWCPWCIKGFPKLKDAYDQYKTELEVIGIDCNDKEEAWRNAVKKYELPWVNVRNPEMGGESKVLTDYAVQGFPTKVIVNPEGKIVNITVGEDPGFFDVLAKFINEK